MTLFVVNLSRITVVSFFLWSFNKAYHYRYLGQRNIAKNPSKFQFQSRLFKANIASPLPPPPPPPPPPALTQYKSTTKFFTKKDEVGHSTENSGIWIIIIITVYICYYFPSFLLACQRAMLEWMHEIPETITVCPEQIVHNWFDLIRRYLPVGTDVCSAFSAILMLHSQGSNGNSSERFLTSLNN